MIFFKTRCELSVIETQLQSIIYYKLCEENGVETFGRNYVMHVYGMGWERSKCFSTLINVFSYIFVAN